MMPDGMSEHRRRGTSLATQVTVAGVGFGLLVAAVFGLLVHAGREQRDATRRTTASAAVVATGNGLERPVIDMLTARAAPPDRHPGDAAGADGRLDKPISPTERTRRVGELPGG